MVWKRLSFYVAVFGCFLMMGHFGMLRAAETDSARLIDLLKSKNILTQQEADALVKEVNEKTKKERAEIKEALQKAAAKGEFLPSALKEFKFGTTIYSGWAATSKFSGNDANTNKFYLERGYLTLSKDINDWLSMRMTTDLFTSKDADDVGNGLELRIKYAYAALKLFGTTTMIGMVPTPSDAYDGSIWPYRVQGKHFLDAMSIQSSADLGIVNRGTFGGNMDDEYLKYGSKDFAGKWGGYMIGLYNGPGYDNDESTSNSDKPVSGLIYLRPMPNIPVLKGLQLAYVGTYGKSNNKFAAGSGPTTNYPDWQVNIGQISLVHPYFGLMGQYYWGKGTKASTNDKKQDGYLASAFIRMPGVEKLRVFGKYYTFNPDKDSTQSKDYAVYVAGLSYDVSKEFMPFVAWEREDSKVNAGRTDYNKYQIGFQLAF